MVLQPKYEESWIQGVQDFYSNSVWDGLGFRVFLHVSSSPLHIALSLSFMTEWLQALDNPLVPNTLPARSLTQSLILSEMPGLREPAHV